jgi:cytochrome c oxidase cbb3-type subunit III
MRKGWLLVGLIAAAGCDLPGKPRPDDQAVRPEQVRDFGKLYAQNCSGCHGADGRLGPAPPLNDPLFLAIVPDAELLRTITEGRAGTPMPPFDQARGGSLTAEQVRVLADGLKRHWHPAGVSPSTVPAYATASPAADATSLARGQMVFARACADCHGDRGQGGKSKGRAVGAIHDAAFLALCSDQVLRRYAITGRPDLGMPGFSPSFGRPAGFQPLSEQDVADLSALLAAWRKAGAARSDAAAGPVARGETPVP